MTQWTPDTCANPPCIFQYTDDGNATLTNTVRKCSRHSAQSDSAAYTNVKEENQRKNISYQFVLDNSPTTALFDTQPDGTKTLKNGITFSWSWSGTPPNTVLTITYTGISLTTTQKNTIQSALNTRFGSGKVLIA